MDRSMRVAMTLEQCWHRVPGGTAVAAVEMARALRRSSQVELVGVAARHSRPPPGGLTPPVVVAHLPLPRPLLYESWHYLRRPAVQRATGEVDVIHVTANAMPPRTAPIVVTFHDLAFLHDPSHFTKQGVRFFNRSLSLALREADLVLCSSRATLRDCEAAGFESERLRLVPLGVDAARASDADVKEVRARYELTRPYILWVGTVEPRKNLRTLLSAFMKLGAHEDLDLVLVGPKGWHEDLDDLIRPARTRVRALGFVPHADMGALYAGAEVFCYPSLREGFGFPVLEAMTQGTPVVTSAGTSTEELADGAGVLVEPTDAAAIAAGIASVLADGSRAARLAEAGRARAAEFTWERTATLVARAYAAVAS